jgi:hypothetical protein
LEKDKGLETTGKKKAKDFPYSDPDLRNRIEKAKKEAIQAADHARKKMILS